LRAGWPIGGTQVIVEDGNTEWLLSHLVKAAIEMWQKKLERS